MPLLLIVLALIAAIPAVFIVDGLLTGEVQAKGGSYRRAEDPGWFWAMIAIYGGLIVGTGYQAWQLASSN